MPQSSGDPVPSIAEADATGEIADLYADIRQSLGMPFVNLVWRNLASVPGGLKWSWTTMKPLYQQGTVYVEARRLRDSQTLPSVPTLPTAALRAVGVDAPAEASIRAAIDGYDRGNPLNIVTFSALMSRLHGEKVTSPTLELVDAGRETSPDGETTIPKMLNFDQMDAVTADMVRAVNLLGARGHAREVQVSLPRNLAHWPGFLSLYWSVLAPLHDDGRLGVCIDAVLEDGRKRGARVAGALGDTAEPSDETRNGVLKSLENLVPNAMGRMIPVVSLLKQMMPPRKSA
jgi:hypothetical protein